MKNKNKDIVTVTNIDSVKDNDKRFKLLDILFGKKASHFNYTRNPYVCGRCGYEHMKESGFWVFKKLTCPSCGRVWKAYKLKKKE